MSSWTDGYREFDSIESMNETILDNMKIIKPQDTLYYLGDFIMGPDKLDNFKKFWARINTRNIVYVAGNHCMEWFNKPGYLAEIEQVVGKVHQVYECKLADYDFWMCHYSPEEYSILDGLPRKKRKDRPPINWEELRKVRKPNIIHTYGHYHNTVIDPGLGLDVGVDTIWNGHKKYTPYELEEILETMRAKCI